MNRRELIAISIKTSIAGLIAKLLPANINDQEQCFYCKEFYSKPVSINHTTEECDANQGWITVAHAGVNLNGREYSKKALDMIRLKLVGSRVGNFDREPLSSVLGEVVGSRISTDGTVEVVVRWFGKAPSGSYLTPTGIAPSFCQSKADNHYIIDEYEFQHLNVSIPDPDAPWLSSFQKATPVR